MISIIIPTRNRYNYIVDLVGDLKKQTVSEIEIIVVDQSDVKREISDVIYIPTDTLGPCKSRNIGAKKASGDILVFLDDDARVEPDFIEELTRLIVENTFQAVAGANCDSQGDYLLDVGESFKRNEYNFIKSLTKNPNSPKSGITLSFPGCCCAVTKEVFLEIGGFDERFDPTGAGEDREMAIKLFTHGYGIWYNAKARLFHFGATVGGSREVGSRTLNLDVNSLRICKKHFSSELTATLATQIISAYKQNLIKSIKTGKLIRTRYELYKKVRREINMILNQE